MGTQQRGREGEVQNGRTIEDTTAARLYFLKDRQITANIFKERSPFAWPSREQKGEAVKGEKKSRSRTRAEPLEQGSRNLESATKMNKRRIIANVPESRQRLRRSESQPDGRKSSASNRPQKSTNSESGFSNEFNHQSLIGNDFIQNIGVNHWNTALSQQSSEILHFFTTV